MKKILGILIFLFTLSAFAAESARWTIKFNEDATATSYTSHFDADGDGYEAGTDGIGVETDSEVRVYRYWIVYNGDTADELFCDANSTAGTQNTAVNDGTKSTSIGIVALGKFTFTAERGNQRSTISCICAAGQTCSNVRIWAVEP